MMSTRKATIAIAALALGASLLTACSAEEAPADGKVKLTVVSLIPGTEQAAFDAFNERIAEFEELNPDIDVEGVEYEWKATTFASQLAGGTLPDVFRIPLTDAQTLIANGQLADITAEVKSLPYFKKFNPSVFDNVLDDEGNIYGIPREAYGMGLQYNRDLFEQAGLDPDDPPRTWDEVRKYAKIISEKTNAAGYMQMTQSNTGGWQLAAATIARGGTLETLEGDAVTVTADNQATKDALEFLRELRWEDDSMGANFLYDWGTINQAFAAGKIAMFTGGSDLFTSLTRENQMDPDDYGLAAIPLTEDKNAAVMGGGTLDVVNVKADDAVKAAAVKWIDFYDVSKLVDKDAAVADAKILTESNQAVGTPVMPIFDDETFQQSRRWIDEYINVPQDQVSYFVDGNEGRSVVGEPPVHTQELYAALDTVVQAVLTDESADIDALLSKVNTDIQALIDAD